MAGVGLHHRPAGGPLSPARGGHRAPVPPDPSLRHLIERQAARLGDRPFLRLGGVGLSFAEVDELANRMASVLVALDVRPGEIVMARCGNTPAMVAAWLGCNKVGSVFMPVNSLLSGEPLRAVMALAGARVAICDAELYPALAGVAGDLPALSHVLVASGPAPAGARSLDALLDEASDQPPPPLASDPGAPAKLVCTSGTTGQPKGVVWSRACEATWACAYGDELLPVAEGEAMYCCLPLFHITCQGTMLAALRRGARMTIDARFDPFGFWNRVRQAEAVAFSFVGTLLAVLARRPPRGDDGDNPVRRILGSAAPVAEWRHVEDRFGLAIVETWGQTETASCWTAPAAVPQQPGTVGRPSSRLEARVVGPDGQDLPAGQTGEMWLRPTQDHVMFDGYLADGSACGRLEVSREAWTEDGWYRTGDLMSCQADGDFSFQGRLREAIRRRGELIASSQVEGAALAHPAVLEAAAVGVPADDGVEQEVKLCAVPRSGAELGPADLHGFLRDRLPKFMVPRYLDIRAELPKTPTTRVRKHCLAEEGTAGVWDARARPGGGPVEAARPGA